ncbi:hypothetical protein D7322_10160 [Sphingobacterium puteale]|uniref:Alpha/beta hydrolase n=2 Tax=Sphingobacterium puteale TaxID=2420510 RepID=A0A420VZU1_9SPHI|nr:hypothetical protein D7322_10160 [Sphingobacterium puteale]
MAVRLIYFKQKMKFKILILFIFIQYRCPAQQKQVVNNEVTAYSLQTKRDTIDFIVVDKAPREKKPIFLWCQGSLPVPLYMNFENYGLWLHGGGIANFDYEKIKKHYHLVVISMPETPLIVDEANLNNEKWYYGDSPNKNIPSVAFQKANYYQNYITRAIKVIKFLRKQKWVDNAKLVVAGHSQGSKIATGIAVNYKHVTKLGLFAANPLGRIDQSIRKLRKEAEQGKISWELADKQIEEQYEYFKAANDPEKIAKDPSLLAWNTLSDPIITDWLSFNKPIYLAYGTNDITSDFCDLIPLYFIRQKKNNLTYKRYFNLEHNFFEVNGQNEPDHTKPHWTEVMDNFLQWTLVP